MKQQLKQGFTRRHAGAVLGASALAVLAGCGGGGGGNGNNNNANSALPSVNLVGLTDSNQLIAFNSRTPGTTVALTLSGLTSGDTLRGIDFRFNPPTNITDANATRSLYALGTSGFTQQLYSVAINGSTATATAVGARLNLATAGTVYGFDFNPTVDRIRVVESVGHRDVRLNPNTGANVDDPTIAGTFDGDVVYDPTDVNAGTSPNSVGAAYNNVDQDPATGTTLYVLDATRNTLTTQGRAADATTGTAAVSPNSGRLFTVGQLSIDIDDNTGFDISPNGNAAIVVSGGRVYGIAIAPGAGRGATTGGAKLRGNANIIGVAAVS